MPEELDRIFQLMGKETISQSLLDDVRFTQRLARIGTPATNEAPSPHLILTACLAAAIGISSHFVFGFHKPLPELIAHQRHSLLEGKI